MIRSKKKKSIQAIRVTGVELDTFKSDLIKDLIKQNVYSSDKSKTAYLSLEMISKEQSILSTLCSVKGNIVTVPEDTSGKRIILSSNRRRALLNAAALDFQIAYDLSPIPTGTERGIVNVQVARNKSGKLILLINNKQFAFKK